MTKKNLRIYEYRSGFGVVAIIAIIVAVGVLVLLGFVFFNSLNKNDSDSATSQTTQKKSDDIALMNLGLESLDSVLVTNDALREHESMGLKGFYAFGEELGNTGRKNPTFEFSSLKPATKIVASIDGVVVFIKEQEGSGDSEVFLQTFDGSVWMVGYDHLTNVTVNKGDVVKVGDVLGEPAQQGNGSLRFEIQINKKADGTELSYCPSALLDASVKDILTSGLASMMEQWETTSGFELYDVASQQPVGCLAETVQP
jgi:hypothetical protein